jgi:hypothetical protein
MSDVEMDDVLKQLRTELDIVPSPEFAAKVRAQVAETPAASRVGQWAMWGALAATAAAVIAVATTMRTGAPPTVAVPTTVTQAAAPPVVVPDEPKTGRSIRASRPAQKAAVVALATAPPVVEVITNQPALIRQAFQQAALQRELPDKGPATDGVIEPLTLSKVVIDPIVIPGGAEVPPAGVSPVIRRVRADDATRSPR